MTARTLEYIEGKGPRYQVVGAAARVRLVSGGSVELQKNAWVPLDAAGPSVDHLLQLGLIRPVGGAK